MFRPTLRFSMKFEMRDILGPNWDRSDICRLILPIYVRSLIVEA